MRHWEDYAVGESVDYGGVRVAEEDILAFARAFDPQPYHVDPAAARASIYGGLIASGLHTASLYVRMFTDGFADMAIQGSPGWQDLKWLQPVRPGDRLTVRSTCTAKRPSASRPGLGLLTLDNRVVNQRGETVMRLVNAILVRRRTTDDRQGAAK